MPDYQLSKIYKLVSNKTEDSYIGSCLMRLSTRLCNHKNIANTTVSKKLFINEAIITIVLIENFPCNNKNELKARELYYITTNNCINVNKPFVCEIPCSDIKAWKKEYYNANSEQLNEKQKEYYHANTEKRIEYQQRYRETHTEQIKARYAEKKLTKNLENTLNNNIIA